MTSRIPTAADVKKVAPSSLPGVRVPTGAHGEQIGAAVEELGNTVSDIALKWKNEEDERDAKTNDALLAKKIRETEFGDGTAENPGYYGLKGQAALEAHDKTAKTIRKYREELAEKSASRGSRARFEKTSQARLNNVFDKMASHRVSAHLDANKKASDASITENTQSAIANAQNFKSDEFEQYLGAVTGEARKIAVAEIGDPANIKDEAKRKRAQTYIKSKIETAVSKVHELALGNLMDRKDPGAAKRAKDYFQKFKGEIDSQKHAALKTSLDDVSRLELAQNVVGWLKMKHDFTTSKGRKAAREFIEGKYSDENEKQILAELKTKIADATSDHILKQKELRLSAVSKVDNGQADQITSAERAAMLETPGGSNYLRTAPQRIADEKAGRTKRPEVPLEASLVRMSDSELAAIDLTQGKYISGLGKAHGYWLRQQKASLDRLRAGSNSGRTETQIRADTTKKMSDTDATKFKTRFDQELAARTAGKPSSFRLPSTELQEVADRLTLELRREKAWYQLDDTDPAFKVPPELRGEYEIDDTKENYDNVARIIDMPETLVGPIIRRLKELGKRATIDNIRTAHYAIIHSRLNKGLTGGGTL
jgi:hypothetical protein